MVNKQRAGWVYGLGWTTVLFDRFGIFISTGSKQVVEKKMGKGK